METKQPFDKVANKNILFIASNAVVTMAYTGDAFLSGIPTDHWIAEKLSGVEINLEAPPMMAMNQNTPKQDIGKAFCVLREKLNEIGQQIKYLAISIQGWQWNSKGLLRPLVALIAKDLKKQFNIYYKPRHWYLNGKAMTIAAPFQNISQKEVVDLSEALNCRFAPYAEDVLVNKIREMSQRNCLIGPHCVSILIPRPSNPNPNILVRYLVADPVLLSESQKLKKDQTLWAYSPWIISPNLCMPPGQIAGGGFTARTGPFTINFDAQTPKHPKWLSGQSGQKRRRWP